MAMLVSGRLQLLQLKVINYDELFIILGPMFFSIHIQMMGNWN